MNGIHDLGGMHGFGPIEPEKHGEPFHADWEPRVHAIHTIARTGYYLFNLDEFRRAMEQLDPVQYLTSSYYERWLASIEANLIEKGLVSREELTERTEAFRQNPTRAMPRRDDPVLTARLLERAAPPVVDPGQPPAAPRYAVGTAVVARNVHPIHHIRLPRYVRGKRGVVDNLRGAQVFPDDNAHGRGSHFQAVYSVRFAASDLWGESAEPRQTLNIDLWESYLEPV